MPVRMVNDKKMIPKITPLMKMPSQKASNPVRATMVKPVITATANTRVATVRLWVRMVLTGEGGGGSTPASGSVASRRWRRPGQKSSSRNSATNGSDGRSPVASTLLGGR